MKNCTPTLHPYILHLHLLQSKCILLQYLFIKILATELLLYKINQVLITSRIKIQIQQIYTNSLFLNLYYFTYIMNKSNRTI